MPSPCREPWATILCLLAACGVHTALTAAETADEPPRLTAPDGSIQLPVRAGVGRAEGPGLGVTATWRGAQVLAHRLDVQVTLDSDGNRLLASAGAEGEGDLRPVFDSRQAGPPLDAFRVHLQPRRLRAALLPGDGPQTWAVDLDDVGQATGTIRESDGRMVPVSIAAGTLTARISRSGETWRLDEVVLTGAEGRQARLRREEPGRWSEAAGRTLRLAFTAEGRLQALHGGADVVLRGLPDGAGDSATPLWVLHAPDAAWADGVVTARRGFALERGGDLLLGDALRWDEVADEAYASGRVLLAGGGLRLEADELGAKGLRGGRGEAFASGEARGVSALLEAGERRARVTARRATFDREHVVFHQARGDAGHGGLLGLRAGRIVAHRRATPALDRPGLKRELSGISFLGPVISLGGCPVLWLPVLHRDFVLDYPWTRYEFGRDGRLGSFVRAQIGVSPPPLAGWRFWLRGLVDRYTHVGTGLGSRLQWRHDNGGNGEVLWYGLADEQVRRSRDRILARREAHVFDAEHRQPFPGGGAVLRWTRLPAGDPLTVDGPARTPPDERFRNDVLPEDLANRPLARRGAAAAWTNPLFTVAADTDLRPHPDLAGTDRVAALRLALSEPTLFGPLRLVGDGGVERLDRPIEGDSATRADLRAALAASGRLRCGLGALAEAGVRTLAYEEVERAATEAEDAASSVPYHLAAVSWRLVGRGGDGWRHILTPSVGYEILFDRRGDDDPGYRFDDRDVLVDDARFLTTTLSSSLWHRRLLGELEVRARWLLRDEERDGEALRRGELHDAGGDLTLNPLAWLSCDGHATWDGVADEWQSADLGARVEVTPNVGLRGRALWQAAREAWEWAPGLTLRGNRYAASTEVRLDRSTPWDVDRWQVDLTRRMVDGTLGFGYEMSYYRDLDDTWERDHRFTIHLTLDAFGP